MEKAAKADTKGLLMRYGMSDKATSSLVDDLEKMGYFDVPASWKYHGSWPGGLFEHSWAVAKELENLTRRLGLKWEMKRSPVLVGMLHDLCKTQGYREVGGAWIAWRHEKRHGDLSVEFAEELLKRAGAVPLTDEEMLCIRWHMGFADDKENWNCYGAAIEKYQNVLWTHTADMVASRVLGV